MLLGGFYQKIKLVKLNKAHKMEISKEDIWIDNWHYYSRIMSNLIWVVWSFCREEAEGNLKGILGYTEDDVVSSDFIGDCRYGALHSSQLQISMDRNTVVDSFLFSFLLWLQNCSLGIGNFGLPLVHLQNCLNVKMYLLGSFGFGGVLFLYCSFFHFLLSW